MLTDNVGKAEIHVPRDRAGTFDPVIVPKHHRKLGSVEQVVLSLTAKGLTTGEISAHPEEIYGTSVSKDTISRITDEMMAWSHKAADLLRTLAWCCTAPSAGLTTASRRVKLYRHGTRADAHARAACSEGWWASSAGRAQVFTVSLTEMSLVEWDLSGARLTVTTWSPTAGVRTHARRYP